MFLDPFHHARQHMALIVPFVWTARMFEMRFGASIWEKYKAKEQCDPKRNEDDPSWPAQRAECAFGDDDAKQSICGSTANETQVGSRENGSRTKVATNGPIAAPLVFSRVAIPVLFIRSVTST